MEWTLRFEPSNSINGWDCIIGLENRVIKDCGATISKALQNTMAQLSKKGLDSFITWATKNNFDVKNPCRYCTENDNSFCCYACKK